MKTKIYISLILIVVYFNTFKLKNYHNSVQVGYETFVYCGGYCLKCLPSITTLLASGGNMS